MLSNKGSKYYVTILREIDGMTARVVFQKAVRPTNGSFRALGKNEYIIDDKEVVRTKEGYPIFTRKGFPMLFYEEKNALPLSIVKNPKTIEVIEHTNNGRKPSPSIFDRLFRQRVMESIIKGSTKATAPVQWYVYVIMGVAVGMILGMALYPHMF